MSFQVRILSSARIDVEQAYDWLAERSTAGAERWYTAFKRAVESLTEQALSYSLAPESAHLGFEIRQRFFRTRRGRTFRILYTVIGNEARVLRVRGPSQRLIDDDGL